MKPTHKSGFTIVEAAISIALFTVLLSAFAQSVGSALNTKQRFEAEQSLALDAFRSVESIRGELRRSGFSGGFPQFFEDDDVGGTFPAFAHARAHPAPDGGQTAREIVFRLPADGDGDGWPDVTAAREVDWDAVDIAYVLRPAADGTNEIWRMSSAGEAAVVARRVVSMLFEDSAETGFAIPLNCVRLRIVLVAEASAGGHRRVVESVIRLPNS
jgi:type II secretory pathway pseudopilin PulG